MFALSARSVLASQDATGAARKIDAGELQAWALEAERLCNAAAAAAGGMVLKATQALLFADLAHDADTGSWVYADSTDANNGVYTKIGASGTGSWSRVLPLPFGVVVATAQSSGTANAIVATSSLPVSDGCIVLLDLYHTNTATPVTVAINGGATLTIKTASGTNPSAGALVAGMRVLGTVSGAQFKLSSDFTSSATLAACEAAKTAAETAAATAAGAVPVTSRTALKALDTTVKKAAVLYGEGGRNGLFLWQTGNYSTQIAADTQEGIYVKANAIAASSGAWVRQFDGGVSVKWFGAVCDNSTDDTTAVQAAINLVQTLFSGGQINFSGTCKVTSTINITASHVRLVGSQVAASGLNCTVANTNVLKLSAVTRCNVENMLVYSNTFASSWCAAIWLENCVQCKVINCWGQGCYHAIAITGTNSADCIVAHSTFTFATGTAIALIQRYGTGLNGGHRIHDNLFNQGFPVSVPTGTKFKGARTNSTAYVLGDIVSSGGYYWQCSTAGTSAASAPSGLTTPAVWYGTAVTDGTAAWQLVGNTSYRGVLLDTGTSLCWLDRNDCTGPFSNAFSIENTLSGDIPFGHIIKSCNTDGPISNGFYVGVGAELRFESCKAGSAVGPGVTYGFIAQNTDVCDFRDCQSFTFAAGFSISGSKFGIVGCQAFGNSSYGIVVQANTTIFRIVDCHAGANTKRGANGAAIVVLTGASDYYTIANNNVAGATSGVSDGGTGTHKTISGNN